MNHRAPCIDAIKRSWSRAVIRRDAPRRWRARTVVSASLCVCALMLFGSACSGQTGAPASQTVVSTATNTNTTSQLGAAATPPSGTPSVRDYAATVGRESANMESSFDRLTKLLQSPKPKDKTWKAALSKELTSWQQIYQEAKSLTPPPAYQQFHAKYLQGLEKFSEAAQDLQNGLNKIDAGLVNSSISKMEQGVDIIAQANKLMPKK